MRSATAFAPATVANVAVGFDILGFAIESIGDEVTVSITSDQSVRVAPVRDLADFAAAPDVPLEADKNAATVGLIKLRQDLHLDFGFEVSLRKGIALGSGLGGSAASAVGGLVAANSLLETPLPKEALLQYALLGEEASSAAAHPDNIAPCLLGGMTLVLSMDPFRYVSLPVPKEILAVVVHPRIRVDTRHARHILKPDVPLADHVRQSARLGGFVAGCFQGDVEMIRRSFADVVIEPQRAPLIPGFAEVKAAALDQGALGASISGSGPSVFGLVTSDEAAARVRDAMVGAFKANGLNALDSWISPVNQQGARIIDEVS
ncbi:MAG TPA: homoserine kinase [Pyrinomonadaceae bacterium]|nr:homoserine kinase [Pyrinomonadaceae bacterium]